MSDPWGRRTTDRLADEKDTLTELVKALREAVSELARRVEEERWSTFRQTVATVFVGISVVVVAAAGGVAWSTQQQTVTVLLCDEVTETRQVLSDFFVRAREASATGLTGLDGEARAAQVERLDQAIAELSSTRCNDAVQVPTRIAPLLDDLDQLREDVEGLDPDGATSDPDAAPVPSP